MLLLLNCDFSTLILKIKLNSLVLLLHRFFFFLWQSGAVVKLGSIIMKACNRLLSYSCVNHYKKFFEDTPPPSSSRGITDFILPFLTSVSSSRNEKRVEQQ